MLSTALQGPIQKKHLADTSNLKRQILETTLEMESNTILEAMLNGLGAPQHAMKSISKCIPCILSRQKLAACKTPRSGETDFFHEAMQSYCSCNDFKRLIRQLLGPSMSSQLVSQSSDTIAELCSRRAFKSDPES
jgi:hypothetical protein